MPSPPPHPTSFQQNVRSSLSKLFPKKANLHAHLLLQFILTLRCKKKKTCPISDVNFLPSWVSTKEADSNVQNTFNIMRIFCTANRGPFGNILHSTFYRVHAPYCVQSRKLGLEGGGRREK